MKRCAFLTLDDPTGFVIDDEHAYGPLAELGWAVEPVPWRRRGVVWNDYDAVVIRSPWDYQDDPEAFLAVLADIERSPAQLFNPLDLVRWNLRKTYLRDLEARGVAIVPTLWRERFHPGDLATVFDEVGADEIVVKPVVGANADGAFRLDREGVERRSDEVEAYFADRALMVQPFVASVLETGEFSLHYFDGTLSHAVSKTPKPRDFRVQEEHGGLIQAIVPGADLHAAGDTVLAALGNPPLYARTDFVRGNHDAGFWLMELELIEPSLYLRMDSGAPRRFAHALDRRVRSAVPSAT